MLYMYYVGAKVHIRAGEIMQIDLSIIMGIGAKQRIAIKQRKKCNDIFTC